MTKREILFRGKSADNGEWVEGNLVIREDPKTYYIVVSTIGANKNITINNMIATAYEVTPETVGRYTGLTDKNGEKIFEWDIVKCRKPINGNWIGEVIEIGYVEMEYGAFGLRRKQGYYRPFKDWLENYEYEVIGNIHDNPELLEAATGRTSETQRKMRSCLQREKGATL